MNNMGIAPHVVEQLLGHSMPGVMAIYNRSLYLPEKLDALNKWYDRLDTYFMRVIHSTLFLYE
jgi:hypothetical protein